MGRNKKVHDQDVMDACLPNKAITIGQLAHICKCSPATIRKRIRSLRKNGEPILPSNYGLILIGDDGFPKEIAKMIIKTSRWLTNSILGITIIAKVTKTPLKDAIKLLPFTKEERMALKGPLLLIGRQIDTIDVEEELE
jgi:predicted transcriptional regulator